MSKKKTNVGKVQKVIWEDHFSTNGSWFTSVDQLNLTPHMNITVGKVLYEDKKAVVIASSWSERNSNFNDPIYILKSCVVSRKDLK